MAIQAARNVSWTCLDCGVIVPADCEHGCGSVGATNYVVRAGPRKRRAEVLEQIVATQGRVADALERLVGLLEAGFPVDIWTERDTGSLRGRIGGEA